MAQEERFVSDLTGEEVDETKAWTMVLGRADGSGSTFHLDLSETEAKAFTGKGVEKRRRGPKPGSRRKQTTK